MRAIKIRQTLPGGRVYSANSPAGPSALTIDGDVPKPIAKNVGEVVVQIKASSVIRDCLTWPEYYDTPAAQLGHDFSGIVVESLHNDLAPGDAVYGMTSARRGGAWADYALVQAEEVFLKPTSMGWEQAAAVPLSAMTAEQAIFEHVGVTEGVQKRVLITGAGGGVGMYLTQFAAATGWQVMVATNSVQRDRSFLESLGPVEVTSYDEMVDFNKFDVVIDTKGGKVLESCWRIIKDDGIIISVDSSSWDFRNEHTKAGLNHGKEGVRMVFFIVEPSRMSLERTAKMLELHKTEVLVSKVFTFDEVQEAYEMCHNMGSRRGRIILVPHM